MSIRTCSTCNKTQEVVNIREGRKNCETCLEKGRAIQKRYRDKDPESWLERTQRHRKKNPHLTFYTTSRYQAKLEGAYSDLTQEDARDIYETANVCAYCGTDHGLIPRKRAVHIDHIIPMVQGGHNTRWNLTKVCNGCNTSKGSASLIDFRERTEAFTQERYDAVIEQMARLSGKSTDEITHLLEQSHEFEIAYQRERERMVTLLSA